MPKQITETNVQNTIYSDFMDDFVIHPVTGDLVLLTNEDAVKAALVHIVLTIFFERPFQPYLGTSIMHTLFENYTVVTQNIAVNSIRTAIINNESRANLIDVYFTGSPDENNVSVSILFSLINNTKQVLVNVPLYRVR